MKLDDLKDGMILVLTRDVANPSPDRRYRRMLSARPVWAVGLRFLVRRWPDAHNHRPGHIELQAYSGTVGPGSEGWEDILAALEEAPRNFANLMMKLTGASSSVDVSQGVLQSLVEMGRITLDDIELARAHAVERNEREWQAEHAAEAEATAK
jgi:hypothetical protein